MKKVIAFIVFLALSDMTFAQQENISATAKEKAQESSAKNESLLKYYQGIIETGYAVGVGKYGPPNLKLNIITSIRQSHYSIGIGVGLRIFFDKQVLLPDGWSMRYDVHIPVFLDNRITFSNKKISPYLALGIGCAFGVEFDPEIGTGLFLNPSTGISWKISDNTALIIGIVYEFYQTEYTIYYGPYYIDHSQQRKGSGSWSLNLGISF